jgi:GNAT superfamily N-acetyltransferase
MTKAASMIDYRTGRDGLDLDEVIELYRASRLGERRPVDDRARMAAMMANANLVVTAWDDARLVGIARSVTDFAFCTYLSDLAVHADYQRAGIGKELILRTRAAGGRATVYLFAAPEAVEYYPHIGMRAGSGWFLPEGFPLR